jgi:hypothetical protein
LTGRPWDWWRFNRTLSIPTVRRDDDDLHFVGIKSELLEVSICAVPADAAYGFWSDNLVDQVYLAPMPPHLAILARAWARQQMVERLGELLKAPH